MYKAFRLILIIKKLEIGEFEMRMGRQSSQHHCWDSALCSSIIISHHYTLKPGPGVFAI